SETVDGVLVIGSPEFVAATRSALRLVERGSMHAAVFAAIGRIQQSPCSGMDVYALHPTYEVGDATWHDDAEWYAGTIVHDSRHAQLYFAAKARNGGFEPDPNTWEEAPGEKAALAYQIQFLKEIHASQKRLDFLAGLAKDPRYQDIGRPRQIEHFDPTKH